MGDRASAGHPAARLAILLLFGATGLLVLAIGQSPQAWLDTVQDWRGATRDWVAGHRFQAALAYAVFYMLGVSIALPGALWFTVGAGFFLGLALAVPTALAGLTAGATLTLLMLRYAAGPGLRDRLRARVGRFAEGFRRNDFTYVILLRVVPLPFFLVNLAAALLGARIGRFMLATAIGSVPSTLVYAGIGAGLGEVIDRGAAPTAADITHPAVLLTFAMAALIALVPVLWRRARRRSRDRLPDQGG